MPPNRFSHGFLFDTVNFPIRSLTISSIQKRPTKRWHTFSWVLLDFTLNSMQKLSNLKSKMVLHFFFQFLIISLEYFYLMWHILCYIPSSRKKSMYLIDFLWQYQCMNEKAWIIFASSCFGIRSFQIKNWFYVLNEGKMQKYRTKEMKWWMLFTVAGTEDAYVTFSTVFTRLLSMTNHLLFTEATHIFPIAIQTIKLDNIPWLIS